MNTSPVSPIVKMRGIGKAFGSVRVLENVDFDIYSGEVHVLAGENGAGKSTLIKILSGIHTKFEGEIFFNDKAIKPVSPVEANEIGISVIHQELSLVPSMNVVDNLFLGRMKTKGGMVQKKKQIERTKEILAQLGLKIDINRRVENLPISIQQLIEITKAISMDAKVIVMDEPSSALNTRDVKKLFEFIKQLKQSGCGIVYISHKMDEIEKLADRITVLRDGKFVGTELAKDMTIPKIVNWMVGREISEFIHRESTVQNEEILRVDNVNVYKISDPSVKIVDTVDISLKKGEILGIGGLQGSGASELLSAIFGALKNASVGNIVLNGSEINIKSPKSAIKQGIAMMTNDRKASGLILPMSIFDNTCIADLDNICKLGWRNIKEEKSATYKLGEQLKFRVPSYKVNLSKLSGGNQQKVIIAKWLQTKPIIMLLDEPTKGIDVGTKHEIYSLMNELTASGISIILITSEMPELLGMSDRIIVMHRGRITAELTRDEISAENVLEAAMGKENKNNV